MCRRDWGSSWFGEIGAHRHVWERQERWRRSHVGTSFTRLVRECELDGELARLSTAVDQGRDVEARHGASLGRKLGLTSAVKHLDRKRPNEHKTTTGRHRQPHTMPAPSC
jgi:hypothetical protein